MYNPSDRLGSFNVPHSTRRLWHCHSWKCRRWEGWQGVRWDQLSEGVADVSSIFMELWKSGLTAGRGDSSEVEIAKGVSV